ncbi:MAG: PAS domain S-box protein [Methanoregula sp.]|uniref:PAS domain S-box protein n=1 Tax=Methanoregula sp. TaxID=2052170 RepID=UPI003C710DD1
MNPVITKVALQNVQDIVSAGFRTCIIAEQLGFDKDDQTRISTAVSEIARTAFEYTGGGEIEFFIDTDVEPHVFGITVRDHGNEGPLIEVPGGGVTSETGMMEGINGAKGLVDHFHIDAYPTGSTVFLGKNFSPATLQVTPELIARIADVLVKTALQNPFEEIRDRNQNLIRILEELHVKQVDLINANDELDSTNRGVVALYAELDDKALSLKAFGEGLEKRVEERTSELQKANTELKNAKEELHMQFDGLAERDRLLGESEERFRISAQSVSDVIWDWNIPDGRVDWYGRIDEILGYAPGEFPRTLDAWEKIIFPDDRDRVLSIRDRHVMMQTPYTAEYRVVRKDGEIRSWTDKGTAMRDEKGRAHRVVGSCSDITDSKRAKEAKIASEMRYRRLFETAQDGILILDDETGQIDDVNPFLITMLGFTREEFLGKKIWEIGLFKDIVANKDNFELLQRKEYIRYEDMPLETADGRHINVEFVSNVYEVNNKKVIQCNIRDITDRKKMTDLVEASLAEKETLLREIHHRVKNNLQIISSLLNLQIRKIDDKRTIEVLKDGQARVLSMALVHEHLYKSKDFSHIDLKNYIHSLGMELLQSYGTANEIVRFDLNIPEIYVDINTAIPLGLIINELITNSLKYGFKGRKVGNISITATEDLQALTIIVADDGVGMPEDITLENQTSSLGLRLVKSLTGQLHGTVAIDRTWGTKFVFVIPKQTKTHGETVP